MGLEVLSPSHGENRPKKYIVDPPTKKEKTI